MDKNQNNKSVTMLLCILIVIVLAFGGFFVYRSLSKNDNSNTKNYITDFSLLPKKSDSSAKEISFADSYVGVREFFTDNELYAGTIRKSAESNGFKIDFEGENDIFDGEDCYTIYAKLDNVVTIQSYNICGGGCAVDYKVIKTDKYYIASNQDGCEGYGKIVIYDLTGKEVYSINEAFTPNEMVVVDNVLYFNSSDYPTYWQSYMDLSLDTFNVVKVKELTDNAY